MKTVQIRALVASDAKAWQLMTSDPQVAAAAHFTVTADYQAAARMLKQALSTTQFGIAVLLDTTVVGAILLYPQITGNGAPDTRRLALSMMMIPKYQGLGIMSVALHMVLKRIDVDAVSADVFINNLASKHVLVKNGFKLVGQFESFAVEPIDQFEIRIVKPG